MTKNVIVLGSAASAVFAVHNKVRVEYNDKLGCIRFRPTDRVVSEDLFEQNKKDVTAIDFELAPKYLAAAVKHVPDFAMPDTFGLRKDKHGWYAVIPGDAIEGLDGMYLTADQIAAAETPAPVETVVEEPVAEQAEEPAPEAPVALLEGPKSGRKGKQKQAAEQEVPAEA
jgi:hypothetical protein